MGSVEHWQHVHATRLPTQVGWYERDPVISRRLVGAAIATGARSLIDIGGGASALVDHVLDARLDRLAVLDIAEAGLEIARARLGSRAGDVEWIVGDVDTIDDLGAFDIWHDRAVFHFLIDAEARRHYVALSERTVPPGGTAVMATFASDGPERCSGLPVHRWDPADLAAECGAGWSLTGSEPAVHTTPAGVQQRYVYATFARMDGNGADRGHAASRGHLP